MDDKNLNGVQLPEDKNPSLLGAMKMFIGVAVVLALVVGGWFIFKDSTSTENQQIVSADLVEESESGISFKRPSQWEKVNSSDDDIDVAYTQGGESLDDSDQGMLLSSEDLGINYSELTDEQKDLISDSFQTQFSDPEALQNGSCQKIGNVVSAEKEQDGYDVGFSVEATCEEFSDKNVQATIKMFIGIKDEAIQIVGVLADNGTWEQSSEALDEILASVKPSN